MRAPEVVIDGFPKRRARWVEIATSADHKDVGRILIVSSLGFLFVALVELLLMRLQLAIPENTFLSPVAFNRMLSDYGATAVFLFAIPLALDWHFAGRWTVGALLVPAATLFAREHRQAGQSQWQRSAFGLHAGVRLGVGF